MVFRSELSINVTHIIWLDRRRHVIRARLPWVHSTVLGGSLRFAIEYRSLILVYPKGPMCKRSYIVQLLIYRFPSPLLSVNILKP